MSKNYSKSSLMKSLPQTRNFFQYLTQVLKAGIAIDN